MKIEVSGSASGSISSSHGSADPDLVPDPHQNVMDPEQCLRTHRGCEVWKTAVKDPGCFSMCIISHRLLERSCCCSRGEKIDTFSYAFEGEMIALLHNKSGFPEGVSSYANVQRQFFESFVGQTFKVVYPPISFLLF
jgi:hypothetical protein